MVIFLEGSSDIARLALADQIVKKHKKWRHLSMQNLVDMVGQLGIEVDEEEPFLLQLACQCAQEMKDEGHHMVLSMPVIDDLDAVRGDIDDQCVFVHFATPEEDAVDGYDYIVNTSEHSVNDAYKMLAHLFASKKKKS